MLYADIGDDDDRVSVPVVRIRADMKTYLDDVSAEKSGKKRRQAKAVFPDSDGECEKQVTLERPNMLPVEMLPQRKRARPRYLRHYEVNLIFQNNGGLHIPQTFKQSMRRPRKPECLAAMGSEMESHRHHVAWELVDRKNAVG
ncbi:hypothetical protein PInf_004542 [Phytophthora infestans]|nr:hypothetical protein PInf_004542 [Phytophthora infestans]